ncbi:MAG: hypothetical protein K8L99_19875 [Anaerolineae bacterium]|nr:hypothetical protein [Anaerolineae bacterium]
MLRIIEQTPDHLILKDRSPVIGSGLALFVLFSLVLMVLMPAHNMILIALNGGMNPPLQVLSLVIVLAVGCLFVYLGLPVALALLRGTTCTFDRASATVRLTRLRRLRQITLSYSLYGISHLRVETNPETHSYALYLMLRSGESVLLAAASSYDQAVIEEVQKRVRDFLRA